MILSFWIHCLCEFEREIEKNAQLEKFRDQLELLYLS